MELRIWPVNWKIAKGNAVIRTSREGYLMPFLRAGILFLRDGITLERYTNTKHHIDTKANWIIVRVIGCGRAFRIDFDDVCVMAEVMYQTRQRN